MCYRITLLSLLKLFIGRGIAQADFIVTFANNVGGGDNARFDHGESWSLNFGNTPIDFTGINLGLFSTLNESFTLQAP